ncbi:hypothetical protein Tco_0544874 [Tanacetum coccineum]
MTEMKKQLPTHVPKVVADFVKPRLDNIKDKASMDSTNHGIPADQPQDNVEELIHKHPNSEWFSKKSRSVDAAKESPIADLEGAGLKMLKIRYKNDVELEYHVNQIKAAMSEEAKLSDEDDDLTKT